MQRNGKISFTGQHFQQGGKCEFEGGALVSAVVKPPNLMVCDYHPVNTPTVNVRVRIGNLMSNWVTVKVY